MPGWHVPKRNQVDSVCGAPMDPDLQMGPGSNICMDCVVMILSKLDGELSKEESDVGETEEGS